MPELPEVETVRRSLSPYLEGKTITGVAALTGKVIKDFATIEPVLVGKKIVTLKRRGKYLLIALEDEVFIVIHLRMTGRLVWHKNDDPPVKHTHVLFFLDDGSQLHYVDVRQFGTITVHRGSEELNNTTVGTLGPEPLSEDFNSNYLAQKFTGKKQPVKSALLDQRVVAGLGNIYVDEALFRAHIHPNKPAGELDTKAVSSLVNAVKEVIAAGIEHRGTSFRDYVDGEGKAGGFQHQLLAYGRGGEPCAYCGQELSKTRVGGRGTVFCSKCQA